MELFVMFFALVLILSLFVGIKTEPPGTYGPGYEFYEMIRRERRRRIIATLIFGLIIVLILLIYAYA